MSDTFVQAKNYTRTSGRQIDLIVAHDMESPETARTAENVAAWFAGSNAPQASAHWCFDNDSAVRCVLDKDVAWHAPGVNHNSLGYEHAGRAAQTREEWLDPYSTAMLELSAIQASRDVLKYDLPIEFIDAAGLLKGWRGITTHWEVSKAFKRSTHWDPGNGFPMDWWLERISYHSGRPYGTYVPPTQVPVAVNTGLLRRGSKGEQVRAWQTILAGAGLIGTGDVDGVFGPQTEAATRQFQATLGVTVDGIVGPETNAAVARLFAWLAATAPAARPTVPTFPGTTKRGSTGSAVKAVQSRLRDRGWSIVVDGKFGPATDAIVRKFQAEKGLAVDGIVGPRTWDALWTAPVT